MLILPNLAVVPEQAARLGQVCVIGENHPPLPGRHVLRRVEAEAGSIPEGACLSALVRSAVSLTCVLHQGQAPLGSQLQQEIHSGHLPEDVHWHESLRLRAHDLRYAGWVHGVRLGIDIRKPGSASAKCHG